MCDVCSCVERDVLIDPRSKTPENKYIFIKKYQEISGNTKKFQELPLNIRKYLYILGNTRKHQEIYKAKNMKY
jgi:hypothetical protein